MGEIGCYVLDLYCDHPSPTCPEVGRAQFTEATLYIARAEAVKAGWQMRQGLAMTSGSGSPAWVCPSCAPLNSPTEPEPQEKNDG